jgi:hypothetical protein
LVADALKLPYRDASCDVAIAIAVAHHMSTLAHRIRLIQELARITRIGGSILIYAWALEQQEGESKRRFDTQDVMVPWNLQKVYATSTTGTDGDGGGEEKGLVEEGSGGEGKSRKIEDTDAHTEPTGARIDEERNSVVYQRFCHVYCQGELESLGKLRKYICRR